MLVYLIVGLLLLFIGIVCVKYSWNKGDYTSWWRDWLLLPGIFCIVLGFSFFIGFINCLILI